MNDEKGGPETSAPKETLASLFFLFLEIFVLNLIFFVCFLMPDSRFLSPVFFGGMLFLSLAIFAAAWRRNRKIKKFLLQFEDNVRAQYEKTYLENQPSRNRQDDLKKTNDELVRLNLDYQETTQKLFQRETELTKANKRLQELDQVKTDFVSVAAHQLRTPLTGIKWSYLALLDQGTGQLNEEQKKIVDQGLENINYTIDLINDLLNTARLDEGKTELNFVEQPIAPIIKEIISQLEPLIKEKNIELDADLPPESAPPLPVDKEKISIVFDNIMSNAVKYTPSGGKITLRHMRKDHQIQFKIKDTGIGIPEKDFSKIFSKFFRSKNAVSFQTSGSGLGLYVAKNIVEKHGGTIELESREGEGTTIIFTLPIETKG